MRKVLAVVAAFITVMMGTVGIVASTTTTGMLWLSMVCLGWIVAIPAINYWVDVYTDMFRKKSDNEL